MALARRVSLFERQITVRLAVAAVDLIHDCARVISEGELAADAYTGSTMLSVDLARAAARISDPPDASTAQRVALLYAADERCREHARKVALGEARRIARCELTAPRIDVESSARGAEVHVSLDLEAARSVR
jgi:hypothetical protein